MINEGRAVNGLVLRGIDGSNPLAFLAALGAFRVLSMAWVDRDIKVSWKQSSGAWRPVVHCDPVADEDDLLNAVQNELAARKGHTALEFADSLTVTPDDYRTFAVKSVMDALDGGTEENWAVLGYVAAFASDIIANDQGKIQDTALRTMSGAGHQHFLKTMRKIVEATETEHLYKTLFQDWRYDDPVENLSMRWDPSDDIRYALQWRKPSGDPFRKRRGGMLGANRLAIEALPLIMSAPVGSRLCTAGFTGKGRLDTFWTWPIWSCPITLDVCRSILTHPDIQSADDNARIRLMRMGIAAVFRSQRITEGKYRNFTPGTALF